MKGVTGNIKKASDMLELSLIAKGANSLMIMFMRDKRIKLIERMPLLPGTLVRHIPTDSIGMIIGNNDDDFFSYGYAQFQLESDGMDGKVIKDLGGSWWHGFDKFEKLSDPTLQSLGLLEWHIEHMNEEEGNADEEDDDSDSDSDTE